MHAHHEPSLLFQQIAEQYHKAFQKEGLLASNETVFSNVLFSPHMVDGFIAQATISEHQAGNKVWLKFKISMTEDEALHMVGEMNEFYDQFMHACTFSTYDKGSQQSEILVDPEILTKQVGRLCLLGLLDHLVKHKQTLHLHLKQLSYPLDKQCYVKAQELRDIAAHFCNTNEEKLLAKSLNKFAERIVNPEMPKEAIASASDVVRRSMNTLEASISETACGLFKRNEKKEIKQIQAYVAKNRI